jgi:hypothetical protein
MGHFQLGFLIIILGAGAATSKNKYLSFTFFSIALIVTILAFFGLLG